MNILVTGSAGFYGHHFVKYLLEHTNENIIGLDRIDKAGNLGRLYDIGFHKNDRCKFIWHNLRAPINEHISAQIGKVDMIFHMAATSHVDRSIVDPMGSVMDNVVGTTNMLEYARTLPNLKRFFYFSTDEVFGSVEEEGYKFKEWDRMKPGNPYSASKGGGELMALAYHNTYNVPVIITHCMNIFGERQHPEKFLPKIMRFVRDDKILPIYCDSTGEISGSRHYVYADTVTEALLFLMRNGEVGEKYNIAGEQELSNLELAQMVATAMDKELKYEKVASDNVRPGNDFAYGISGDKMKDMGFESNEDFSIRVAQVIEWYINNPQWYML